MTNITSKVLLGLFCIMVQQPRGTHQQAVLLAERSMQDAFLNEFYFVTSRIANGGIVLTLSPAEKDGKFIAVGSLPSGTTIVAESPGSSVTHRVIGTKHKPIRSSSQIPLSLILKAMPQQVNLQQGFYFSANRSRNWGSSFFISYCRKIPGHDAEITRWINSKGIVTHER